MTADFTVLMAVYARDEPSAFERALKSVFNNGLLPKSVILVVDGPVSSQIRSIIDSYKAEPIFSVVELPENRGLSAALNVGLGYVGTEWVVRADADDINRQNRFELLCAAMDENVDLLGSYIREVEPNGRVIGERRVPISHDEIIRFMQRRNPFNHMSVAFRTQLARECGGYPRLHLREDYALWVRMSARGARMRNLAQVLVDATAGLQMYERRGGWKYTKGEWGLQTLLVNEAGKPRLQAASDLFLRSFVFLAHKKVRGIIYKNLLRSRAH